LSSGGAALFTNALGSGSHTITAAYSGNQNFAGSLSSALVQVVNPPPDFSIVASPSNATIHDGQSASFTLTLTSQFGFNSQVNLSCGPVPQLAQCQFVPATVNLGSSPIVSTLTITTVATTAGMRVPAGLPGRRSPFDTVGFAFGFCAIGVMLSAVSLRGRKRKVGRQFFNGLIFLIVVTSLVGCGGGSMSPGASFHPGTPLGTSTVAVTAATAGGSSSHSVPVTLTIVQ
jgi:hypothetical protein